MKSTQRYELSRLTHNDLVDLVDKLKQKSATEIFHRLGIKRYAIRGTTYATPGIVALRGLPKKAPLRVIDTNRWYRAEELVDVYKEWASDTELEKIIQ